MKEYLETNRLFLRNFCLEDLDALTDYRSNPLCSRYQRGQFTDRENLRRFIEKTQHDTLFSKGAKRLAAALRETGEIVGDVAVFIEPPTITIGYTVSYRYHRRGFAFELLSELTAALHERYPQEEIVCCTDRENEASIGLLTKLGFKNEGYSKEIDSLIFSLYAVPPSER